MNVVAEMKVFYPQTPRLSHSFSAHHLQTRLNLDNRLNQNPFFALLTSSRERFFLVPDLDMHSAIEFLCLRWKTKTPLRQKT